MLARNAAPPSHGVVGAEVEGELAEREAMQAELLDLYKELYRRTGDPRLPEEQRFAHLARGT